MSTRSTIFIQALNAYHLSGSLYFCSHAANNTLTSTDSPDCLSTKPSSRRLETILDIQWSHKHTNSSLTMVEHVAQRPAVPPSVAVPESLTRLSKVSPEHKRSVALAVLQFPVPTPLPPVCLSPPSYLYSTEIWLPATSS